jgi:ribonuclease HI
MENVTIYTDGSSLGNPGPGGYAAILIHKNRRKELSGGFRLTTNNRMELKATIEALKAVKNDPKYFITIHTDSKLICDAFNKKWLQAWIKKGWRKSDNKDVLNQDLWKELHELVQGRNVKFEWVKGHAGQAENERCDELCKAEASMPNLPPDYVYEGIKPPIVPTRSNLKKEDEIKVLYSDDKFVIKKSDIELILDRKEAKKLNEQLKLIINE